MKTKYLLLGLLLLSLQGCHYYSTRVPEQENQLKYNYYENEFEYAKSNDKLKFNYYEQTWSYENPDSELSFNPYSQKWEWKK